MTIMNMTGGGIQESYGGLKIDTQPPSDHNYMTVIANDAVADGLQIDKNRFITSNRMYIYKDGTWTQKPFSIDITLEGLKLISKTPDGYLLFSWSDNIQYWLVEADTIINVITKNGYADTPACANGGRYFVTTSKNVEEVIYNPDHTITTKILFTTETSSSLVYYDDKTERLITFEYIDTDYYIRAYTLSGERVFSRSEYGSTYHTMYLKQTPALGDQRFSLIVNIYNRDKTWYLYVPRISYYTGLRLLYYSTESIYQESITYCWMDGDYVKMAYRYYTHSTDQTKNKYIYLKFAFNSRESLTKEITKTDTTPAYGALVCKATSVLSGMIIDGAGYIWHYD